MDKPKEFRVVLYFSRTGSGEFYGGRLAASPLACYYYQKRKGKVLLGTDFLCYGLGKYHDAIKDHLDSKKVIKDFPIKLKLKYNEDTIFSKKGYIYQNEDPIYDSLGKGIYWQFDIEKVGKITEFSNKEIKKYYLPPVLIGIKGRYDSNDYLKEFIERKKKEKRQGYSIIASNLRMLRNPIKPDNKSISSLIKTYNGDGNEINFYKDKGQLPTRNNTFIHLKTGRELPKKYFSQDELGYKEIASYELENNHINESLVHELLKIHIANEGKWYMNDELSILGKKKNRIDFLIKKSLKPSDNWTVIELKKGDGLEAVNQLAGYIDSIRREVKKKRKNSTYFDILWNKKKKSVKPIGGVILCAKNQISEETKKEAKKNNFSIWPYKIRLEPKDRYNRSCNTCEPRLWIDLEKEIKL